MREWASVLSAQFEHTVTHLAPANCRRCRELYFVPVASPAAEAVHARYGLCVKCYRLMCEVSETDPRRI